MYIETFLKKYFFYTLVRIFLNSVHTHKTNKQNKTKTFQSLQIFRESVPKKKKKKNPQIRYLNSLGEKHYLSCSIHKSTLET